ncbi:MAG TPA: AfsR/SARP family transcriptional regulator, partial [Acidimicrobiia bacterium]
MEVRMLGPLEVIDDAGDPVDVGGERPRTLLVDLALERGHTVPADRLLDDAWGDEAPTRNTLQVTISRLRRALGSNTITTQAGGYVLDIPSDAIDVERFDHLASAGRDALRAGDAADAAHTLRNALALWRGTPLADVAGEEFARPVITRLEEAHLATIEDRIDADLALGEHTAIVGELEALVREHPVRERLWAQLMTALYRSGRQSEALQAYQRARTMLLDEFGIEPGPALRELERAVLAQETGLDPPESADELRAPRAGAGNLPEPPNELVGRRADLDAAANLVQRHRIATIVGTGGVGKTRLAVEVGRNRRE